MNEMEKMGWQPIGTIAREPGLTIIAAAVDDEGRVAWKDLVEWSRDVEAYRYVDHKLRDWPLDPQPTHWHRWPMLPGEEEAAAAAVARDNEDIARLNAQMDR